MMNNNEMNFEKVWDKVEEELAKGIVKSTKKEVRSLRDVLAFVSKHSMKAVYAVIDAEYIDVASKLDKAFESALVQNFKAKRMKDVSKEVEAYDDIEQWVDAVKNKANGNKEALKLFGMFLKSLIIKILNALLKAGKIIGIAVVNLPILLAKVVCFPIGLVVEYGEEMYSLIR